MSVQRWDWVIPRLGTVCNHESVLLNSKIYTFGGWNGLAEQTMRVFTFNTNGGLSYESISGVLNVPRYDSTTAVLNGKIYIIGGHYDTHQNVQPEDGLPANPGGVVEEFDPITGICTRLADAPFLLEDLTSVAYNGKIYVTGGTSAGVNEKKAWTFDGTTWASLPDMLYTRSAHSMVEHQGKIYAIGGRGTNGKSIEAFDGTTWSLVTTMPGQRYHHGSAVLGDNIYVVAGIDDTMGSASIPYQTVFKYNITSNTWLDAPSIPFHQTYSPERAWSISRFGVVKLSEYTFMTTFGWNGTQEETSHGMWQFTDFPSTEGWYNIDLSNKKTYVQSDGSLPTGLVKLSDGETYFFAPSDGYVDNQGPIGIGNGESFDFPQYSFVSFSQILQDQYENIETEVYQPNQMVRNTWLNHTDGYLYRIHPAGYVANGQFYIGSDWYYAVETAGNQYGNKYYPECAVLKDMWRLAPSNNKWVYYGSDGKRKQNGFFQVPGDTNWYYAAKSTGSQYGGNIYGAGECLELNWLQHTDGFWYWFKQGAKMAKSESVLIETKTYNFDANGHCLNP